METKKITIPANKTNCIQFGKYVICLEKDQLSYYADSNLTKVVDVAHDFTNIDLYELGCRISEKNNFGPVNFVHKQNVIKNR